MGFVGYWVLATMLCAGLGLHPLWWILAICAPVLDVLLDKMIDAGPSDPEALA